MKVALLFLEEAPPGLGAAILSGFPAPLEGGSVERVDISLGTCWDRRRRQLDAAGLLELLPAPGDGWVHLGVVGTDLGLPAVTYVFGLAELGSRRGVVSWARLREQDELWELGTVTKRRLLVEAVHEVGHAMGLPHCAVPSCAMHRSMWPESTDLKDPSYCPFCLENLLSATASLDDV